MRTCGIHPQAKPETSRFPCKELPHMPVSLTTPGWAGARNNAPVHVAFRETDNVGTRNFQAFAAPWLAYVLPCRRFAVTLAGADARLGSSQWTSTEITLPADVLAKLRGRGPSIGRTGVEEEMTRHVSGNIRVKKAVEAQHLSSPLRISIRKGWI